MSSTNLPDEKQHKMAAFPIDSMRRRRAAIQQAIGFLGVFAGRMEACGQHPVTSSEYPDFVNELKAILDAWPLSTVEQLDGTTPSEKHSVWIMRGTTEKPAPQKYEFDTLIELNAFLEGVDQGNGWRDFEQFDTEEEAMTAYKKEPDDTDNEGDPDDVE
jgi:hypothetical protein